MRRKDREISKLEDIEAIIKKSDVCRIALVDGNKPYIVTMNFGYTGGTPSKLYFHCASEGRKLDIIRKNNNVCFEMDTDHNITSGEKACDFSMSYKSVVGSGKIFIVSAPEEKVHGMNILMGQYSDNTQFEYREKTFNSTVVLRLDIDKISGKSRS